MIFFQWISNYRGRIWKWKHPCIRILTENSWVVFLIVLIYIFDVFLDHSTLIIALGSWYWGRIRATLTNRSEPIIPRRDRYEFTSSRDRWSKFFIDIWGDYKRKLHVFNWYLSSMGDLHHIHMYIEYQNAILYIWTVRPWGLMYYKQYTCFIYSH